MVEFFPKLLNKSKIDGKEPIDIGAFQVGKGKEVLDAVNKRVGVVKLSDDTVDQIYISILKGGILDEGELLTLINQDGEEIAFINKNDLLYKEKFIGLLEAIVNSVNSKLLEEESVKEKIEMQLQTIGTSKDLMDLRNTLPISPDDSKQGKKNDINTYNQATKALKGVKKLENRENVQKVNNILEGMELLLTETTGMVEDNTIKKIKETRSLINEELNTGKSVDDTVIKNITTTLAILAADGMYDSKNFIAGKTGFLRKRKADLGSIDFETHLNNLNVGDVYKDRLQYLDTVVKFVSEKKPKKLEKLANEIKIFHEVYGESTSILSDVEYYKLNQVLSSIDSKDQGKNSNNQGKSNNNQGYQQRFGNALQAKSLATIDPNVDAYAYILASQYQNNGTNILGSSSQTGNSKKQESFQSQPGVTVVIDKKTNGPVVTIDKTKLPPTALVEGYLINKQRSEASNAPLRAKDDTWNYGFAIMDEIVEHPESAAIIMAELNAGGVNAGEEIRGIFNRTIFDESFQKSIHVEYQSLLKNYKLGSLPPERNKHKPNAEAELSDSLLQITFLRQFPGKYKTLSNLFTRHTDGDKTNRLTTNGKIDHFVGTMGYQDIPDMVRQNVTSVDLEKEVGVWEAGLSNGVTKDGGLIDNAETAAIKLIREQGRSEGVTQTAENTVKFLGGAGKTIYNVATLGALGYGVVTGVGKLLSAAKILVFGTGEGGPGRLKGAALKLGEMFGYTPGKTSVSSVAFSPLGRMGIWLGLSVADKKPGTQGIVDLAGELVGNQGSKSRNEQSRKIDALDTSPVTASQRVGISTLLGSMSMGDLIAPGSVITQHGSSLSIDFSKIDKAKLDSYLPTKLAGGNLDSLQSLSQGMGDYLIQNYGLTFDQISILAAKYPSITLNECMKRFEDRESDVTKVGEVLKGNGISISDEKILSLKYMNQAEYVTNMMNIQFIIQQSNKLMPDSLKNHMGTITNFLSPEQTINGIKSKMTGSDIMSKLLATTDGSGIPASSYLKNLLSEMIVESDPTELQSMRLQYFKVLRSSASQDALKRNGTDSIWTYGADYNNGLARYFHDSDIGKFTNITLSQDSTIGGLSEFGTGGPAQADGIITETAYASLSSINWSDL